MQLLYDLMYEILMTKLSWSSANPIPILRIKTFQTFLAIIRIIILFHSFFLLFFSRFFKWHCIFMTKGKISKQTIPINDHNSQRNIQNPVEHSWKPVESSFAINLFCQNGSSQMFNWNLNMPLVTSNISTFDFEQVRNVYIYTGTITFYSFNI